MVPMTGSSLVPIDTDTRYSSPTAYTVAQHLSLIIVINLDLHSALWYSVVVHHGLKEVANGTGHTIYILPIYVPVYNICTRIDIKVYVYILYTRFIFER